VALLTTPLNEFKIRMPQCEFSSFWTSNYNKFISAREEALIARKSDLN
jgi:hypothetical protein